MIKKLTLNEIREFWFDQLWSERYNRKEEIPEINCDGPTECFFRVMEYTNNYESIIFPEYIGFDLENEIVGVLSGYKTNKSYYRIRGLCVKHDKRRLKIATKMVKYFEDKASDCKYIWSLPRFSAIPFYESCGFETLSYWEDTIYGKTYYMRKIL